jgi:hypothetical protein
MHMLKRTLILLVFLLSASLPAAAENNYSIIIEDLPLMPGMVEKTEAAVIFDKPGGRIVETDAETTKPASDITKFYAATLPPLGWQPLSKSGFTRDGEILSIDIEQKNGTTFIHFSLTPTLAPNSEGK